MAKAVEHGLKKVNEIYDQGDLMCELNRTTILTRQTNDDGSQAYGKINVVKGMQWNPIKIPSDVLLEKCKLLGSDQIVGVVSGKKLSVYDTRGHHIRLIDVQKKGRVKTVENINAIAVITDKILVAESQRYNNLIHVVDYNSGDAVMSLTIDQKITGIIPIRTGLVLVRLKEKIQAVDYAHYPRVDITEVIAYGRTLVNMCVKGGNDELYVMFVKGVTSKVLEIHVLDDKYQELHRTKITHSTSILSLRAVYTSQGPGYLVIQMGSTIFTFKCSFGHRKGPAKESELKSPTKKKFYAERQLPPPSVPKPSTEKEKSEDAQTEKDKDDDESAESAPNTPTVKQKTLDFGPVLLDSNDPKSAEKEKSKLAGETTIASEKTESRRDKPNTAENRKPNPSSPKPVRQNIQNVTTSQDKPEMPSILLTGRDSLKGKMRNAAEGGNKPDNVQRDSNQTSRLPDEAQNTPAFESSYIGEEGGVIQSNKYGFSLSIPPGAIAKGQRKWIGVGLSRESPTSGTSAGGVSISPMICSEPSGLELEKPARINLQHCLSSWSNDTHVRVHELAGDSDRQGGPGGRGNEKEAKCLIGKNGELTLDVTRLGRYSLTVMGSEVYKKLVCRPFIPKRMPTTKKPIINVLIYDLTDGMKKMMMEEIENESPYPVIPAHIGKNFIFNLNGQDAQEIQLTCHAVGYMEVKSLSASELIEFKSNSVDFQVDCSNGRAQDITIELCFGNKKIDMICHVDIPSGAQDQHSALPRYQSTENVYSSQSKPLPPADVGHQTDVPSQVIHEIASEVPHNYYIPLGLKLGLEKAKLDSILVSCASDSEEATYRALEAWKNRIGVDNRERLRDILVASDLRRIAEKFLN
ncbi:uncharacterized protein LOC121429753 [Lytechinus variegatus]|uniref:uncharacterized protein LOC121429753 n=1 Tax=Lytechinus variegatus TaxID=7654 RepID=UPI001BB2571A|nr:uncharacterized protein LOC121429753 [Lytechinus variegatus]